MTDRGTCVMVWDESEPDRHGDEVHIWWVQLGDDDGEPIGAAVKTWSMDAARITASGLHREYGLPVEWY